MPAELERASSGEAPASNSNSSKTADIFVLEMLNAGNGDAMLLHVESVSNPRLFMIDGGPHGCYRRVLWPRLHELRNMQPSDEPLPIKLLVLGHMDDPQSRGVLDLQDDLIEAREENEPRTL